MKAEYTEDQLINIVVNHESNKPNMNSTIKKVAEIREEINKPTESSDTKKEGVQTHESTIRQSLKKMG
jgi:hypothetical protein